MILIIENKISAEDLEKVAADLNQYIKFVVDVERGILAAGGTLHVDEEKILLENGSAQPNLWGGGLDLETGEIDFESMINLRPNQGNTSREVLDPKIREKMLTVVRNLLL
jgi:hypothetical protein